MSRIAFDLDAYLGECRAMVLDELRRIVPREGSHDGVLYDRMFDYPLRHAKGLRPGLCIATCRALGGGLQAVLPTAAVLELYHNAFLIHDDIEDGSLRRRGEPTLHRLYGMPVAINIGDAMLALTLQPLLDNMRTVGMGPALRVLQEIADMARVSSEGQAIELEWIRANRWDIEDADYVDMVAKKTARYTFITPVLLGAIIAGHPTTDFEALAAFARDLGVAFQIQDDILNLVGDEHLYGKESCGDLWEGKHTLVMLHALRSVTPGERERALAILAKPRPESLDAAPTGKAEPDAGALGPLLAELHRRGEVSDAAREALEVLFAAQQIKWQETGESAKISAEVSFLHKLIRQTDAVEHARTVALAHADRSAESLAQLSDKIQPSVHTEVFEALVRFVVDRNR